MYELNLFTKRRIETQFDGPLRMNFDAVDMAKYLNYGLNYKNTFAYTFAVLAVVQFLSSGKSLITSLSLTVLILTAEDVQAKETKGRKQVAASK